MDTTTKFWLLIGAIFLIIICIRVFIKKNERVASFLSLLLSDDKHECSEDDLDENIRFRILKCDIELLGSQDIRVHILVDNETQVQYLVLNDSIDEPIGITPLLCEDGEPMLYDELQLPRSRRFHVIVGDSNNLGLDELVAFSNIVIDTETGVQYLVLGGLLNPRGITPLLCENGEPMLYDGDLDEFGFTDDQDVGDLD